MDWTLYWFMFPVAIAVATLAMLSGIGGAALFTPIFLIVFPLLGAVYPLASPEAAIGAALLTVTFGFSSGFIGYFRRGLIDFRSALPFIAVGLPLAIAGALLTQFMNFTLLKAVYGLLMIVLAALIWRYRRPAGEAAAAADSGHDTTRRIRSLTARDGTVHRYPVPRQGAGAIVTATGGFLTGLLSVGIGEMVIPQLVLRHRLPVAVAAGTSVAVTIAVVIGAMVTQLAVLIAGGGVAAVPWNLVCYTVPGVIIGGQIGPLLHGIVSQAAIQKGIAGLFLAIGIAMAIIVYQALARA